ncbi:Triose-phosphate Transporter [Mortierella sp. AD011]|nr:Triose-phosphate Transporter [Mortierella sp. AD011]
MREGTKLARRLSQQIPKSSSPLNQYIPTLASTANTANTPSPTTTPSEEKSFKRFSYQQGTLLQQQQQLLHQSTSGQDTSVPGPIVTRTAISSPNIAINTSSARNTPPGSIGNARTPLGSILASSLGHAGGLSSPVSPSANSPRHFRYPSAPASTPPSSASPSINSAAIDKSSGADGISTNLKNYAPSVFINIGQTSSSLPQILMPKKRNLMGKDNWNFNLPLFVSSIHAGLHFVITACLMHFFPESYDATRSGKGGRITMHSYVTQVVPCAIAAALEICMANASLMYITLSFYTMIKSSTPIWVLVFAFFFRLEKPRWSLILIIGVIVVGVILTVAGEAQFDMTGFILVLLAAVMSGLRWSLTQMLLQKDQLGMDNPVATLYYISPIMFVLMSILSLAIEDPFVQFSSSEFFTDFNTGLLTMMMAGGGGFLAFAMTVAEFKLIKNTGTVTLSVAGISKEIVVISLSMVIFGDRLTFVNLLGLLVSIGGIVAYNYDKIKRLQHNTLGSGDYEPLGPIGRHHKGDNTD